MTEAVRDRALGTTQIVLLLVAVVVAVGLLWWICDAVESQASGPWHAPPTHSEPMQLICGPVFWWLFALAFFAVLALLRALALAWHPDGTEARRRRAAVWLRVGRTLTLTLIGFSLVVLWLYARYEPVGF